MLIISGYQGVGKSTFAKEKHLSGGGRMLNCVDFESSNYDKSNPEWYKQYVNDALMLRDVDVLFLSSHQVVRDELNRREKKFYFIVPFEPVKWTWAEILAKRVLDTLGDEFEREKNIRALMSHILYYDEIMNELSWHKRAYEAISFISHPVQLAQIVEDKFQQNM